MVFVHMYEDSHRRGRRRRGEERIDEILRAALELIGRDGLGAVTHRTVAGASGVPLGSITYYFATKQDLLRAALELFVAEDVARLRAAAGELAAAGATGEEVVGRFAVMLEGATGGAAQFELYLEASRDPELRQAATESLRAYAEVAALALRAAGVPDADQAAAVVVAAVDGLGLHRLAAGPEAPPVMPALTLLWRALADVGNVQDAPPRRT
jgi:TetR/AcrR family transcriptional regulator, regulator of biofilm formation and stress response